MFHIRWHTCSLNYLLHFPNKHLSLPFCLEYQMFGFVWSIWLSSFYFVWQRKKVLQGAALSLLRSDNTVFDKALVLCQMHNFKEGVLYLYEKGKLWVFLSLNLSSPKHMIPIPIFLLPPEVYTHSLPPSGFKTMRFLSKSIDTFFFIENDWSESHQV